MSDETAKPEDAVAKPKSWNEDSGRFPVLIDLERPEEAPGFFDDIEAAGAQIDAQLQKAAK